MGSVVWMSRFISELVWLASANEESVSEFLQRSQRNTNQSFNEEEAGLEVISTTLCFLDDSSWSDNMYVPSGQDKIMVHKINNDKFE